MLKLKIAEHIEHPSIKNRIKNGIKMKFGIMSILFSISFGTFSEETLVTKEINAFIKLSTCLDNISISEITSPDHKIAKNLSLITSVIENITLQLGSNHNEQKEFRGLYNIALKHCKTEIERYKNIQQQTMGTKQNQQHILYSFLQQSLHKIIIPFCSTTLNRLIHKIASC